MKRHTVREGLDCTATRWLQPSGRIDRKTRSRFRARNPGEAKAGAGLSTLIVILLCAVPAFANPLTLDGPMEQGGLVRGHTEPDATVALDGRRLRVAPDGVFIFGFPRNAAAYASLDVAYRGGGKLHRVLSVAPQHYQIQRINGLPKMRCRPTRRH